jgi:hypothetical protein
MASDKIDSRLGVMDSVGEGTSFHDQEHPSANERLEQAIIFLSDEDANSRSDFAELLKRIEEHILKGYAIAAVDYDAKLYNQVLSMVEVHKRRMRTQNASSGNLGKIRMPLTYSTRLAVQTRAAKRAAALETRREDHPPFTQEYDRYTRDFIKQFHSDSAMGERLRKVESDAFAASLREEVLERLGQKANFEVRAVERGRNRAGIQMAMQLLGSNQEQHFLTDWERRVVTLPKPALPHSPEVQLSKGKEEFEWTAVSMKHREEVATVAMLEKIVNLFQHGYSNRCPSLLPVVC